MTTQRSRQLLAAIGVAALLSNCSVPAPKATPVAQGAKYPLYTMNSSVVRPVYPTGDHNIAWIDDERVLFEGLDRNLRDPVRTNRGEQVAMRGLYIWNLRTNQVTPHTREALRSFLCFADGHVSYSVYRAGEIVRMEGPFGAEKPIDIHFSERHLNPFTCKSYEQSSLPKPIKGGGIQPLRTEHGWIEHAANASWLRTVDEKFVQLKPVGQNISLVQPQKYSAFSQKYIFWRASQDITWLVDPKGTLHRAPPPSSTPSEGRLEPAAGGATLLRSTRINVRANWDPGQAGLYVFTQSTTSAHRVVPGLIDAMQVHGQGCLVAMIVDPWDREGREHQLKVVNICV